MLSGAELLQGLGGAVVCAIATRLCIRMGAANWRRGGTLPGAWRPYRETSPLVRRKPWLRRYWMAVSMSITTGLVLLLISFCWLMPHLPVPLRLALMLPCFPLLYYPDLLSGQLSAHRSRLKQERERRHVAYRITHGGPMDATALLSSPELGTVQSRSSEEPRLTNSGTT